MHLLMPLEWFALELAYQDEAIVREEENVALFEAGCLNAEQPPKKRFAGDVWRGQPADSICLAWSWRSPKAQA